MRVFLTPLVVFQLSQIMSLVVFWGGGGVETGLHCKRVVGKGAVPGYTAVLRQRCCGDTPGGGTTPEWKRCRVGVGGRLYQKLEEVLYQER
jgi:hypothetical protein